jgi:purine-nucleoside phosphorylase
MTDDPYQVAVAAADVPRQQTGVDEYAAAVVLGSGWNDAADALGPPSHELGATDLPGFVMPCSGPGWQTLGPCRDLGRRPGRSG